MHILQDIENKIKQVSREDWMVVCVIVLVALLAFGFGRLSVLYGEDTGFRIEYPNQQAAAASPLSFQTSYPNPVAAAATGSYVASKNGTKYYLLSCSGVKTIKEENKVYFATAQDAQNAGYEPAANCKF